jgi:hypothetical protein
MLFTESQIVDNYVQMRGGQAGQNTDQRPHGKEAIE